MPQTAQQNFKNHVRYDPAFHFFLAPVALLTVLWTLIHLARHWQGESGILVLLAVLLLVVTFKARSYALRVQDRVIRLEERLRLLSLMPEAARSIIPELTEAQFIALRFASDAELPPLAERAAKEKLAGKQIKQAIRDWRADYWRV